jgi:hypothetical protein
MRDSSRTSHIRMFIALACNCRGSCDRSDAAMAKSLLWRSFVMARRTRGGNLVGAGNSAAERIRVGVRKWLSFSRLDPCLRDARCRSRDAGWLSLGGASSVSEAPFNKSFERTREG